MMGLRFIMLSLHLCFLSTTSFVRPLTRSTTAARVPSQVHFFKSEGSEKELVHSIESLEDFNEILAAEKGIVVIKFYASFCRACKTMAPKFRQLASHHDQEAMTFAQIELLANKDLCKALGIRRVPSVHFYHAGDKVEDFVCGPKKIPVLKERLEDYVNNGIAAAMSHSELLNAAELADTTDITTMYDGSVVKGNSGGSSGSGAQGSESSGGITTDSWSQLKDAPTADGRSPQTSQ